MGCSLKEAAKFASQFQKVRELSFLLFWRSLEIYSFEKLTLIWGPQTHMKEGIRHEDEN